MTQRTTITPRIEDHLTPAHVRSLIRLAQHDDVEVRAPAAEGLVLLFTALMKINSAMAYEVEFHKEQLAEALAEVPAEPQA